MADGARPVAGLGEFAGSLATWQNPRLLTQLELGRGSSAPAGTVTGIVDTASGPPGPTSLPPSDSVPLLGGSSGRATTGDVVPETRPV